jgi:hypothetical protein
MTEEQFWKGDPYLAVVYRDVATRKRVETNEFLWLEGRYVYEAIFSVIHNAFSKKGAKPIWYPEEPYRITPETEEEKQARAEAERQKAIKSLTAWKDAWDRAHV